VNTYKYKYTHTHTHTFTIACFLPLAYLAGLGVPYQDQHVLDRVDLDTIRLNPVPMPYAAGPWRHAHSVEQPSLLFLPVHCVSSE